MSADRAMYTVEVVLSPQNLTGKLLQVSYIRQETPQVLQRNICVGVLRGLFAGPRQHILRGTNPYKLLRVQKATRLRRFLSARSVFEGTFDSKTGPGKT